ncbi:MAG: class I SAM-dependent rRNA methyltransferase [Ignavibacteriales bacterium]|nr:class I SAM-dependent rRNA methyltransferase [Ignavibacteriales bacterium]
MSTLAQHVILKKNEEKRLLNGHQWIFSNEIHRIEGAPKSGDVVEILRSDGRTSGIGLYNPLSLIAVRFLSSVVETIDENFFERRIRAAYDLRKKIFAESETFRVVYGESDFLPGLIIDKYDDYISVQTFSAGMDSRLQVICDVLEKIFQPKGIVERNESSLRALENIPERKGILRGSVQPAVIELNGLKFSIDILNGQKSGFFLDQRENRLLLKPFSKNVAVLDCFSNEGGFGLYAASFGAASVDCVDISDEANIRAKENASLNSLKSVSFHTADVFKFLDESVKNKKNWNVVILDPPSFTKSRKNVPAAIKGYKEINTNGLKVVTANGIFLSASCSHHIDQQTFLNIIADSSVKANRKIKLLKISGASPDHPTLPSMPETHYLKCALFSVE